jgi:ClpP class serine protease
MPCLVSTGGLAAKRQGEGKIEVSGASKGKIAVVYAEGEIVDGTGNEDGYVYGEKPRGCSGKSGRTTASARSCSA